MIESDAVLTREELRKLSPVVIRAISKISVEWNLSSREVCTLLGGISASTWHRWRRFPHTLSTDQMARASLILGIYDSLNRLHSKAFASKWLRMSNSNAIFFGESPLDTMMKGAIPAMLATRALVDSRAAGY